MKVAILADNTTMQSEASLLAQALQNAEHQVELLDVDKQVVAQLQAKRPEICCIASGTKGSEGALQELLELLQIPYLGSQSEACRLSSDTQLSMFAMRRYAEASEEDVIAEPLVNFSLSSDLLTTNAEALADMCEARIPGGYPIEIKPLRSAGFSQCMSKFSERASQDDSDSGVPQVAFAGPGNSTSLLVNNKEELLAAFKTYESVGCTVCQWIEGLRLSVAVLGTGWDAHVLPPVEEVIASKDSAEGASAELIAPVRLESLSSDESIAQAIRSEIERTAFEACLSLGMRDFALVRVIWDGAQVRFVGIEALPSMAANSAFSKACEAAGLSVAGVLNHLVSL
ncbi:MAG: hypothetical protein U0K14_07030 [Eggerthellaceae bacterium]|nr:hypothetical protein [Eggerthellaceae bacterium]